MEIIENFDLLTPEQQKAFAKDFIEKINATHLFGTDIMFKLIENEIDADELTGGLDIGVRTEQPVVITRNATWQCGSAEEAKDVEYYWDIDYENPTATDAEKAFSAELANIDGYKVILTVDDAEVVGDIEDIEILNTTDEDDGIGHYEYFGATGYDSRPFCVVEGRLTMECECSLRLYIEAI